MFQVRTANARDGLTVAMSRTGFVLTCGRCCAVHTVADLLGAAVQGDAHRRAIEAAIDKRDMMIDVGVYNGLDQLSMLGYASEVTVLAYVDAQVGGHVGRYGRAQISGATQVRFRVADCKRRTGISRRVCSTLPVAASG